MLESLQVRASTAQAVSRAVAETVARESAERERLLSEANAAVQSAEAALVAMSARRREACNRLQEANGSIRVLCRVRPLTARELEADEPPCVTTPAHNAVCVAAPAGDGTPVECAFDAAFGSVSAQHELYEEVSPAVASVLSGQYVCIMAYGQTGAGKTWTMQGGGGEPGVVHLACDELLREAASLQAEYKSKGEMLEVRFECSMLEVYNEKVFDLMNDQTSAPEALELRSAADGTVSVVNLALRSFDSAAAVSDLLIAAGSRRHT